MSKIVKYEFIKIDNNNMLFKCYDGNTGKIKFEKIIDKNRKKEQDEIFKY